MTIALRRASARDIPFIAECETRPGYAAFVGHWPDEEHAKTMSDPDWCYLIGARGGVDGGFAILSGLHHRNQNMLLKRIAVRDAGAGFGRPFLACVMDWVFTETPSQRFWLEVVEHNPRARHVYKTLGFAEEGVTRGAFNLPEGGRGNFIPMSILRPEWEALRG